MTACTQNCRQGRDCTCRPRVEFGELPAAPRRRSWRLTFSCDGSIFVWTGLSNSIENATSVALADLTDENAEFNRRTARLIASIER